MNNPIYLTVSAITKYIKRKFDADPHLTNVYIKGEISNFKRHSSGHMYFTLKDDKARILAVMFSAFNRKLKFEPENGMNVLITGDITVYEQGGQYQIYVKEMQPDGVGELFVAFEQLKEKLQKEGLFAPERKKKIPSYPESIGVITSPTGAAIRDILTTIKRRYPIAKVTIFPALVQGERAAPSIVEAIRRANEFPIDVLIVGRGGGSIEELWAFNEEIVARAIAESTIPIISAVGHETDFTIADYVADLRAPTPTGAAELAVPNLDELMDKINVQTNRLLKAMRERVIQGTHRLEKVKSSFVFQQPYKMFLPFMERLDYTQERLIRETKQLIKDHRLQWEKMTDRLRYQHPQMKIMHAKREISQHQKWLIKNMVSILTHQKQLFQKQVATLDALSPLKIMNRGYSVVYNKEQAIVKRIKDVAKGDQVTIRVTDGQIECTVQSTKGRDFDEQQKNV
ncbi:MAG: exodeoxyribonuclease VII large subunit [Bacillus sp. (in: Bacteria)]|nr:exodeoxyribonuclease VII large subunit [Bacillus sp. (in: firmicutes)]